MNKLNKKGFMPRALILFSVIIFYVVIGIFYSLYGKFITDYGYGIPSTNIQDFTSGKYVSENTSCQGFVAGVGINGISCGLIEVGTPNPGGVGIGNITELRQQANDQSGIVRFKNYFITGFNELDNNGGWWINLILGIIAIFGLYLLVVAFINPGG
jgi:hypothetical protein